MNQKPKTAAFYDLEGTLVRTNLVHTLAFYAKRQQGLWQTAKASVGTLAGLSGKFSGSVQKRFGRKASTANDPAAGPDVNVPGPLIW